MDVRPWPTLAGLVVVFGAAGAVLVRSGVTPADVLTWFALLAAGVLLPGIVATRVLRGPAALAEDLACRTGGGGLVARGAVGARRPCRRACRCGVSARS